MPPKRWWEGGPRDLSRADISYWFPKLKDSDVMVPDTRIIRPRTDMDLFKLLDGETPAGYEAFLHELLLAVYAVISRSNNCRAFLRTGQTSGKHEWARTCFLPHSFPSTYPGRFSLAEISKRVAALVEWSASDNPPLPVDVWAARDFVDFECAFTAFNGMPVTKERRFFVRGGEIVCSHPYWHEMSIEKPSVPDWRDKLREINSLSEGDRLVTNAWASLVAASFRGDGSWSVDFAKSISGKWYAIDMAPAEWSYHWLSCPHATEFGS